MNFRQVRDGVRPRHTAEPSDAQRYSLAVENDREANFCRLMSPRFRDSEYLMKSKIGTEIAIPDTAHPDGPFSKRSCVTRAHS